MRKRFKNYLILEELASSLWTTVYKAVQEPLDRLVSLKVLNPKMADEEELLHRFEREAKICANLVHPNIVRLFDYGRWRGEYFIVQEWVDGASLKELLEQTRLPLGPAVYIIREVATGLAHAHSREVIHRDIKPGNILVGKDGSVKITDFGLACSLSLPEITLEGTFLGTPAYGAPEQAKGTKVDERADIFSLGVTSYEILTGSNPFAADSYSAIIEKICHISPKLASRLNPTVPAELSWIVRRMLAKRAGNRYQNLGELLRDLDAVRPRFKEASKAELAPYLEQPPSAGVNISRSRSKRVVWLYPLLAGVMCLVVLAYFIGKPLLKSAWRSGGRDTEVEVGKSGGNLSTSEVPGVRTDDKIEPKDNVSVKDTNPTGKSFLSFRVEPWARVYVDGQYWEVTPTDRLLSLEPGRHKLTMVNDYLPPHEELVNVRPGETLSVKIDLMAETSWLMLSVRPWGEVYVDGAHVSTTPLSQPVALRPGRHRLVVTHPSLASYETTVELTAGDTLTKTIVLDGTK